MRTLLPALIVLISLSRMAPADPLKPGDPAPHVSAVDEKGAPIRFGDIYAKGTTLVYFYPKAGTTGCTAEACSLRDSYTKLHGEGLQIIGVSRDAVDAQAHFQDQYHLPFTLVADSDGKVAQAFGVPMIPNKELAQRQSFIVKNDKIVWNSLHAQTKTSAEEVQQALDHLN